MKQAGTCSLETSKLGQSGGLPVVSEHLADIWLVLGGLGSLVYIGVYCADIDHLIDLIFGLLDVALLPSKQEQINK